MCGICGIMQFDRPFDHAVGPLIDRMTDTMAHRGPDDRGTWWNPVVALGARRLSIIDLSLAGHMPMCNEDGSIWMAYNGEVYNFRALKQRFALEARGHHFRSQTDTEVLIHLYEELGVAMAQELNGMFAIALWDNRQQALYLFRDRFGIKPLFYQQDAYHFRFGSEIKAILADGRVPRQPSLPALHDFLSFDYIPGSQTAFVGIHELPPAHWLQVDTTGKVTITRYWDLHFQPDEAMTEAAAVAQSLAHLDQAVKRQLVADVPIGVMLSGGMDSSTIVALMARHVTEPIHTYSVGFEEASFNEIPYARVVAKQLGTVHREVVVTPALVRAMLPGYLTYIDEPYGDGSAIPTYYVSQLAKGEVKVLLSGEGGDEVFAGYETYSAYRISTWFRRLPAWLRHSLIAPLVRRLPVSDKKLSLDFKLKRFMGGQDLSPAAAHLWWRLVLSEAQKLQLYTPAVLEQMTPAPTVRHFTDPFDNLSFQDTLSRLMYLDANIFLPDDLMIKNDRMSMAHSIEARVPMTDNDLVAFLARVPARLKLKGLRKKHLMRQAMTGILPPVILNKKKVGLEMPYSRWFKHELKELLFDYLGPTAVRASGLFQPQAVQRLIDEHLAGRMDHGRALWGLLNYMMWLELYITPATPTVQEQSVTRPVVVQQPISVLVA